MHLKDIHFMDIVQVLIRIFMNSVTS